MVVCMLDDKYPDMQEINDQPSKSDDVIITSFDHQSALNVFLTVKWLSVRN